MKKLHLYLAGVAIVIMGVILLLSVNKSGLKDKTEFHKSEKVTAYLKWVHQAQFAGMYMAKEKGFYKEIGLDVELVPFQFGDSTIDSVLGNANSFGVTGSTELISAVAEGKNIKAIATIYQKSPYTLYSLKESNIINPKDMIGKRVGVQPGTDGPLLFGVMLDTLGIDISDIDLEDIGYAADELIAGDVDISMGYIINEPQQAIEAGYEVNNMLMADYGATLYGDILFATDSMISENPELVSKFVKSTIKGWQYAVSNIDEAVQIVLKYAANRTLSHEKYMLQQSIPLINTGEYPIGWMAKDKWQNDIDLLTNEGVVKNTVLAEDVFIGKFISTYL